MNVYEAIAARRTIRDFAPRSIPLEVLQRILGAGLQAPSHNHLRQWNFILVEDIRQREALASFFRAEQTQFELESMLDSWNMSVECQRLMYLDGIPKQVSMILNAGALLIPCFHQPSPVLGEMKSLHELNAFASMWAVLENILIAAASEDVLGVTKIVSTPEEAAHIRNILAIPEDQEMPCYLALGYRSEDAVIHKQVPVDLQERISIDRWSPSGE
ncbi:nitroreductase family protein [Candidatus Bipolaricaulota bacterium]|nr:nitroreductase family protein [Candidatus Bipolaricaulota bacterium]